MENNRHELDNSGQLDDRSPGNHEDDADAAPTASSGLPDWLSVAIVAALGLYFVVGGIAWIMFIDNGLAVPEWFTTILATIAGGLVGVLAPAGGPARPPQSREQRPTIQR
jgi:hypothetical protein